MGRKATVSTLPAQRLVELMAEVQEVPTKIVKDWDATCELLLRKGHLVLNETFNGTRPLYMHMLKRHKLRITVVTLAENVMYVEKGEERLPHKRKGTSP